MLCRPLLVFFVFCTFFSLAPKVFGAEYTAGEGRAAWKKLKTQPVTEATFRQICDLAQDIGKNNLAISYEILAEYLPILEKTKDQRKIHVILMGWARAKESLHFFEEAEQLYVKARKNARSNGQMYREALVNTVLLYAEWDHPDSLQKYLSIGFKESMKSGDKESLSFLYTFKGLSYDADTTSMRRYLLKAIDLAKDLENKNALFTARYNYANIFLQYDPLKQVKELESLVELAQDSSLHRFPRRLYERTAFTFRSAGPSIYYQLIQLNLMLTDFETAWKFAELFYDSSIKPNPNGAKAPYFMAEMSIVKSCQRDFVNAQRFLDESRTRFKLPEDKIPYISYFVAAGLLAEHKGQFDKAENYYKKFVTSDGFSRGLHVLPVELYYAHILTINKKFAEADKIFGLFTATMAQQKYSAIGYYYTKYRSEYLKAKGDYVGYSKVIGSFYEIKDSLTNLNQYRALQEVMTKVRMREKEQQISSLNEEKIQQEKAIRKERIFYGLVIGLASVTILLLILYLRNRLVRNRQKEALQQSELERIENQRHIDLMQGVMAAEEKERRKIADQLHDEVSAMLALASLSVSSTLEKGRDDAQGEKKLQKTQEILSSVSSTIRDLSHQLNPLVIEKYGFREAIMDSSDTINLSGKIKLETVVLGFEDSGNYNITFLNDLYRIIQELLHNILKHAKAAHASLEVVEHQGQVTIIAEDDGVGLNHEASSKGQGLSTIRSRVAYLNGKMEISNKQEGGVLVVIEIYFEKPV